MIQSIGEPSIVDLVDDPNYADYGSTIFLTHLHRHEAAGFHGTVANLASISRQTEETGSRSPNADELMKLLAERGNMAAETLKGQVLYIAVLDHFSIGDVSNDVAILSSYDPGLKRQKRHHSGPRRSPWGEREWFRYLRRSNGIAAFQAPLRAAQRAL